MLKSLLIPLLLVLSLAACGEDDNPLFGTWKGSISPETAADLGVPLDTGETTFLLDVLEDVVMLNGKPLEVTYDQNNKVRFIYEVGSNRAMSAKFSEDETDRMVLRIPSRRKRELFVFEMVRVSDTAGAK